MKCPSCKKENGDGIKFCKFCGSPIGGDFKKCANGHNYDSSLPKCPFCPSTDFEKTVMDSSPDEKTAMDKNNISDKTILDTSRPVLTPNANARTDDKTIIYKSSPKAGGIPSSSPTPQAQRKLIGWLVTFDINPNGTDYRLFEGRTRIGKRNTNDVIVNQPGVSEEHAIMLYRDGKIIIEDKLSTNGTFVNGISIDEKTVLKTDDELKIGSITLKLKLI